MNDQDFSDYVHKEQPTLISGLSRLAITLAAVLLGLGLGISLIRPWLNLERGPCVISPGEACPNLWESIISLFILVFMGLAIYLLIILIKIGWGFIRRHYQVMRNLTIGIGFFALALFTLVLSVQFVQWLLAGR
jgi:hypothetical protein